MLESDIDVILLIDKGSKLLSFCCSKSSFATFRVVRLAWIESQSGSSESQSVTE